MELYSKKVMERFTHPKNMGEIKNADGIGKVGNPVCLLPDVNVQFNGNLIQIKQAKKNDNVLSHNGEYNKVKRVFKRRYKGKVLKIKNRFGEIVLTPEHECLAIKVPKTHHFLYLRNKKKKQPAWYHAEELVKGDILLYPILKETIDLREIKLNIKKKKYDFKGKHIPNKFKIENEFLRLTGYYLSEGSLREEKCKTYLSFTFNIKEKEYVDDIRNIVNNLFKLDVKIEKREDRNSLILHIYNVYLTKLFKELFNKGAENKRLPNFMLLLPPEKQKEIIKGLWRGDGFVNLKIPRAGFCTISPKLCNQLKILLLRQKIIPSIYKEKEKIRKGIKHRKSYRIHVGHRESFEKLLRILEIKSKNFKKFSLDSWIDDNFAYIPINSVEKFNYRGYVYNLETYDSKSYVTEAATVHNCGDVMWLYLKVDKKKGIIKDVKVKTFGCVAAIATSTELTEMIKGKTIEEAEKISKQDVADALGGLPKQKFHCSILAVDALKKAIEDYRKKQK